MDIDRVFNRLIGAMMVFLFVVGMFTGVVVSKLYMTHSPLKEIGWYVELNNDKSGGGASGSLGVTTPTRVFGSKTLGYSDISVSLGWSGNGIEIYIDQAKEQ